MFVGLSDLSDRIIESLVWEVNGDLHSERLRIVQRWVMFYAVVVTWILIAVTIQYTRTVFLNQQWTESNKVIEQLFQVEDNPLAKFVEINEGLSFRLEKIQQDHVLVLKENILLERDNRLLLNEINKLKSIKTCESTATKNN